MNNWERYRSAERYFRFLSESRRLPWVALYGQYEDGQLDLPELATLVHPQWTTDFSVVTRRRQHRAFSQGVGNHHVCASEELWGYTCPFDSPLQVDHRFPWALGGPTCTSNALYLCRDHNLAKGHDVHVLAWRQYEFDWLVDEVEEIAMRLGLRH